MDGRATLRCAFCGEPWTTAFASSLADEMGVGARSVYYAVELVKRAPRRRREAPEARAARQLALVAPLGGAR